MMTTEHCRKRVSIDRPTDGRPTAVRLGVLRPAEFCYEVFCDVTRMTSWISVLRSVSVRTRHDDGKPREVAFLASLDRATLGYTLTYSYDDRECRVAWCPQPDSGVKVEGWVKFRPLTPDTCVMICRSWIDPASSLPSANDPLVEANVPLELASRFRSYVSGLGDDLFEEVTEKCPSPVFPAT